MVNQRYSRNRAVVAIKPKKFIPAEDRFKSWTEDEYWDWLEGLVGAEKRDQIKECNSQAKFLDFTDQMHLPFST